MKKYSELTIIFSNCLEGGTGWNSIQSKLMENLYSELSMIEGLEFKLINSNTVRGEHNSFSLIFSGVFFNLMQEQTQDRASRLLEYIRNAANRIEQLSYSEIRIECTRHMTIFNKV
jgi:hypothetical protein